MEHSTTVCKLRDFGPTGGQHLELADNEEEIRQLFTRLHDLTMH